MYHEAEADYSWFENCPSWLDCDIVTQKGQRAFLMIGSGGEIWRWAGLGLADLGKLPDQAARLVKQLSHHKSS